MCPQNYHHELLTLCKYGGTQTLTKLVTRHPLLTGIAVLKSAFQLGAHKAKIGGVNVYSFKNARLSSGEILSKCASPIVLTSLIKPRSENFSSTRSTRAGGRSNPCDISGL